MPQNLKKTVVLVTAGLLCLLVFAPGAAELQQADKKLKKKAETDEEVLQPQGPPIKVEARLVNVEVTVTDKKGNLITGLQREHFKVYEDGVLQQIDHFAAIEAPMTVVLLVEYSRQVEYFIQDVWEAVYLFVDSLRPEDWAAIVAYDIRPEILTDFTRNRADIHNALRRLNYPAFSESNLSDAVHFVLDSVKEEKGRIIVVLVSTGLDTFSKHNYSDVLKEAKSSNAVIYSIGVGQNFRLRYEPYIAPETNIELLQSDNRLRSFSNFTGGTAFFPRFLTELPSVFRTISNFVRNQYSLGYVPSNTRKDGKFRKIKVEVQADVNKDGKPDQLEARYREGYFAEKS
ncbi:MAG: VWA domain-containing protein [Acidobacteria bacterium]|nr:VWA domain-containing protein [Acidobacteriota bacterium]